MEVEKDSSPWPADSPDSRVDARAEMEHQRASEGVKGDEIAKREPLRGERAMRLITFWRRNGAERAIGRNTYLRSFLCLAKQNG